MDFVSQKHLLPRFISAAGILLFVSAFVAVPLANAFQLCAMTCCHPPSTPKMMSKEAAPCGTPQCTISAPDVTMPAAPAVSNLSLAFIIDMDVRAASAPAPATPAGLPPDTAPPGASAPIHILNSTFRI